MLSGAVGESFDIRTGSGSDRVSIIVVSVVRLTRSLPLPVLMKDAMPTESPFTSLKHQLHCKLNISGTAAAKKRVANSYIGSDGDWQKAYTTSL